MRSLRARWGAPLAASVLTLVAAGSALAQGWVDPPAPAAGAPTAAPTDPAPARPQGQAAVAPPVEVTAPPKTVPAQPSEPPPPKTSAVQPSAPVEPGPTAAPPKPAAPAPRRVTRPAPDAASPPEPPVRSVRRHRAPAPEAEVAARGPARERSTVAPVEAAQQLAADYLAYWSAPNAITLDSAPNFYGPRVLFHGRVMSASALAQEKRRFLQRWPERRYAPRPGTMRTSCERTGDTCTVRMLFDFTAANPAQGARSQGVADLELGVSFAGRHPVIVFETSQVVRRGRGARSASLNDAG